MTNPKDQSIAAVVDDVTKAMADLDVVDEWDADLYAIGFAKKGHPDRIVYVCTFRMEPGRYFVVCDTHDSADADKVLQVEQGVLDLPRLLATLRSHLFGAPSA